MKLKDITNFDQGVAKIMGEKIDFKLAYRLTKIVKKIEPDISAMNQAQKKLYEKYAEKTKDGLTLPKKNLRAFNNDFEELLDQEIKIDFEPIPLELLKKQETVETEVLIKIYPFIEPDGEAKPIANKEVKK